jgi:hypothetical protein
MTKSDYRRLRRTMRAWMHTKRNVVEFDDYADSRLVVQIQADAQTAQNIQRRIDQIRAQLPGSGTDPMGFRIMAQNWARRRSHTIARIHRREHAVEMDRRRALWAARAAARLVKA